jgi:hypothetical protein
MQKRQKWKKGKGKTDLHPSIVVDVSPVDSSLCSVENVTAATPKRTSIGKGQMLGLTTELTPS